MGSRPVGVSDTANRRAPRFGAALLEPRDGRFGPISGRASIVEALRPARIIAWSARPSRSTRLEPAIRGAGRSAMMRPSSATMCGSVGIPMTRRTQWPRRSRTPLADEALAWPTANCTGALREWCSRVRCGRCGIGGGWLLRAAGLEQVDSVRPQPRRTNTSVIRG